MDEHTAGVLEGLGYCLTLLLTRTKTSQAISERIVEITKKAAQHLDFRTKAMA